MSHAEGSSPSIKSSGNVGFQVGAATGSWCEGVTVLVMVLAPIGLAAILMAIDLSVIAIRQIARDSRQSTNAGKHAALRNFVVRYRQLDRRGSHIEHRELNVYQHEIGKLGFGFGDALGAS